MGAEILKVPGVADYDNLKLNGSMGNVVMKETEVPELESLGVTTDE